MKRGLAVLVGCLLAISGYAAWGWAQEGEGIGWLFDPAAVETAVGTIEAIDRADSGHRMGRGVHLTLKTDAETLSVRLGPDWYVEKQEFKLAAGDAITVAGSRVELEGEPILIAARIQKGADVLILRDPTGRPLWAGAGRPR